MRREETGNNRGWIPANHNSAASRDRCDKSLLSRFAWLVTVNQLR